VIAPKIWAHQIGVLFWRRRQSVNIQRYSVGVGALSLKLVRPALIVVGEEIR
jgi:hypothetical protein